MSDLLQMPKTPVELRAFGEQTLCAADEQMHGLQMVDQAQGCKQMLSEVGHAVVLQNYGCLEQQGQDVLAADAGMEG